MYNLPMLEKTTKRADLEKQLEACYSRLREVSGTLGRLESERDHAEGDIVIAPSLRNVVISKTEEEKRIEAEFASLEEMIKGLDEGQREEDQLRKLLKSLTENERKLSERLGAIAYEQAQREDATPALKEIVAPYLEREEKFRKNVERGNLAERVYASWAIELMKRKTNSLFFKIFKALEQKDLNLLSGKVADSLLLEYDAVSKTKKEIQEQLERRQNLSLDLEEKVGEGRKKKKISVLLEEAKKESEEAAISYGLYLFENGGKWINSETSEEELDLVSRQLELRNKINELQKAIDKEKTRNDIYELELRKEKNAQTIKTLRGEQERIEDQIKAIEEENRSLQAQIAKLGEDDG